MPVPVRLLWQIALGRMMVSRNFMYIANPVSASFGDFPVKNAFRLFFIALMLVCLSAGLAAAQTATPTPTPRYSTFTQVTSSTANAFVGGISADGRFVVFESTGDLATFQPTEITTRAVTNADGNREIFLYDYAQRRIFQITNTTSARKDATKPALSINTTTGLPDYSNVDVEVSNNRPFISRDGRWIVFSSNADTPFNFDGDASKAALKLDGNQEVFLYRIPAVAAVDLRGGVDSGFVQLGVNDFTRVTDTPASRVPVAGTATTPPIVADDNRSAQVNDRASRIVFVSTRNRFVPNGAEFANADANPEIFAWTRTSATASTVPATGVFAQVTNTTGLLTFNDNPNISGGTTSNESAEAANSVLAFVSNSTTLSTENGDANEEIFIANFDGAQTTGLTQATRTQRSNASNIVNVLNPGPRISRDGRFLAFESVATSPTANTTTNEATRGLFVYVVPTNTFIQVGPRGLASASEEDVLRFPVFAGTGDTTQLVFTSALNFTPAGARVPLGDATGFNPSGFAQIYSVPVPNVAADPQTFSRLTTKTFNANILLQPYVSNTIERIAFSFSGELGGGNGTATSESNASSEVFYLNVPPAAPSANDTPASASALAYFTGATEREVVTPAASPTPTPSPTPAATPITGLAPGMIGIVRKTAASGAFTLAATSTNVCPPDTSCDAASELQRRPPLPVELAGVSLSVNNAAAGLYFVSPTQINFVVPRGLAPLTGSATYPVVINVVEGGASRTIRSVLQIVAAQPDIFSTTNGPGGRAVVGNATNPITSGLGVMEPFNVTTTYVSNGQNVTEATKLRVLLTGVRGIPRSAITVRLVKADGTATDIVPGDQIPTDPQIVDRMPGAVTLDFRLPSTLAGAGDVSIIVIVNINSLTFTSRPVDTAPKFRIN
jgi:uncharacterized protein (TIGR03437 family)